MDSQARLYSLSNEEQLTAETIRELRDELARRQREQMAASFEAKEKIYEVERLQIRLADAERSLKSLQGQAEEDRLLMENEIKALMQRQRTLSQEVMFLKEQESNKNLIGMATPLPNSSSSRSLTDDEVQEIANRYEQELTRLNRVVKDKDDEIVSLKLQVAMMTNQEARIEENLVTMVLSFSEIEALRNRVKSTEQEVKEVRKSFIHLTVENDMTSGISIPFSAQKLLNSQERLVTSHERLDRSGGLRSESILPEITDKTVEKTRQG